MRQPAHRSRLSFSLFEIAPRETWVTRRPR